MPLTTRCRHCGRLFPVYAQQIKERHGKVACPQCGKRFDAVRGLLDEATPDAQVQRDRRGIGVGGSMTPAATAPAEMLDLSEGRRRSRRARALLWYAGILVLAACLTLQVGWWDRGRWLGQPWVRTAAESLCNRIGCRITLPRLAGTMEIMRPALTEREESEGGLRLTLILINHADITQRLPQLQLELYDEKGDLAAARRFGPDQYLAGADPKRGLPPGKALRPILDIQRPPSTAVGFRVKLF